MNAGWLVAVDAGGTGTRLRALGPGGERMDLDGPGVGAGAGGAVIGLVTRFCREVPDAGRRPIDTVAAGVAGLVSLVPDPAALAAELAAVAGAARCAVAADVLTAHLGALDGQPGAVIAAGTGAIALGTDFRDVWVRVDGWGHLIGDLGSGAWIGMEGLRAAAAYIDGRGGLAGGKPGNAGGERPTAGGAGVGQLPDDAVSQGFRGGDPSAPGSLLAAAAEATWGPLAEWPAQLYPAPDRAGRMAGFARDVAACADHGDAAALAILHRAGAHLATTLAAALAPGVPPRAAATGGVFKMGPVLTDAFHAHFARLRPGATLVPGASSPLEGAVHLASLVRASAITAYPPFLTLHAA